MTLMLSGIDVSAVGQGLFDWNAWRGRVQFAGIKISEGTRFADPDAERNVAGARSIGAAVMGYHFLHANSDGAMQADWFMARCKAARMERGDLLALDVEQGGLDGLPPGSLWGAAVQFATVVHDHFGCWPVIYTDISMAGAAPGVEPLGNCPLWLANPSRLPVGAAGPWKLVSFEQTGQRGVDTDVFYGDRAQLGKLAIPVPRTPPAPAVPAAPPKPTLAEALAAYDVIGRYLG